MKKTRVVIIDDDKKSQRGLEEILATSGHDLVLVNNALSAADSVVQEKPDVILLELKMSHKTGFEIADEIRRKFKIKKIPIIAMASTFKDEFHWLFDLYGIERFLRKPFHPLDVIWAVESEMGKGCSSPRGRHLPYLEFIA